MPGGVSFHDGATDPDRISTRQEFADGLTLLRERAGLTVRDVAQKIGLPSATVGGYFGGRHLPPVKPADQLPKIISVCGVDDAAEIEKWRAALSRVRRAPGRRPAYAPVPYRGLKSFQPEDADWFYGRQRLTDILLQNLSAQPDPGGLLAVVGPSGSGKSSLLRAGLIPALRSNALGIAGSAAWPLTLLTPGVRPARELATQLTAITSNDQDRLLTGSRDVSRLVIVVDQFEEIFTLCQDESERLAFITALCGAADRGPEPGALVIIGLRADFYPHALRYPELVSALQSRQILVGPMTEEELRSAITGPARRAGLDIEDGLVEVLLRDLVPAMDHDEPAAHDAGALPLLSHALLTTWERSHGGRLTVADYRDSGGIHGAVAASAEEVYAELTDVQKDLARQIFTRLVHVADDTADTRRRVPRGELLLRNGDAQPVLDAFIDKRLITAGNDEVEMAHEALLHAWPRLRQWIDSDSISVRTHHQLRAAAEVWRDSDRDSAALYGGGRLEAADEWAALPAHNDDLNSLEREFLDASIAQRLAAERSARRQNRKLRSFVGALAALFLVAGTLAIVAYQQKNVATSQRDIAISRQVATDADQLRTTDIALAMQLSLAAYRISPTADAISSLLDSTASVPATRLLAAAGTEMHSVAFNPGDTVLAAGSGNGTVRLWSLRRRGHPVLMGTPLSIPGAVFSVQFSPDGNTLAIGSSTGLMALWNVADPRRPIQLGRTSAGRTAINSVAYSPDGQTVAAASADGQVYLWSVANPRRISPLDAPLKASAGQLTSVAFAPDGRMLAAGGTKGHLRLWDLTRPDAQPRVEASLSGPADGINAIAISPNSRTLAAAGNDSRVWLWTISGGQPAPERRFLSGATSWIYSLAFSTSGDDIAAGSADDNAYIWNLASEALTATLPHPDPVLSVAYGPGGSTLATGDANDVARIWSIPGPVLTGAAGSVFAVAFSPDGHDMAEGSAPPSGHGEVQLWNLANPGQPTSLGPPLTASGAPDGTVAYGPGGRLAAGGGTGSIMLWNVRNAGHPIRLHSPPTALTSAIQYVTFDTSGRLMAAASTAGTIELWNSGDFPRMAPIAVLPANAEPPGDGADSEVFSVVFSPNDKLLASASLDGTVRLWDMSDPARPHQLGQPLTRLTDAVYQATFSPDGHILAASGEDGKVRLWDVTDPRRPRLLSVLSGPAGIIYDVTFSPDGRTLATADGDKTIALWNIANPATPSSIGSLTGPSGTVFSAAFSLGGDTLAAGSQDGTTRVWIVTPTAAAQYVCAIAGDPITAAEWAEYIPESPYNPPCKTN